MNAFQKFQTIVEVYDRNIKYQFCMYIGIKKLERLKGWVQCNSMIFDAEIYRDFDCQIQSIDVVRNILTRSRNYGDAMTIR